MKRERVFNVVSLILNICIVIFVSMMMWIAFRSDFIHDDAWFGFTGWMSLRFFTVLSNIFLAITCIIMIVFNIKNIIHDIYYIPKWAFVLKFAGVAATTVTLMTVVLLLAPMWEIEGEGYFTLFEHNNFFMHFVNPVLGLVSFIFFERNQDFRFKHTFFGLIPVGLYSILYITMVALIGVDNGGWPDFYNLTFGGNMWAIPISAVGMYLSTFLYCILIWFFQRKWVEKKKF